MKTVEEIKTGILAVLDKAGLDKTTEKLIRNDLSPCFTTDCLLTAIRLHIDKLAACGAVGVKMLQESFPQSKLEPMNIHIGGPMDDWAWHEGEHWFFGTTKAVVAGKDVTGHFYEQSYGRIVEGYGYFHHESSGLGKDGARLTVMDKARVEAFGGSVNLYDHAQANIYRDAMAVADGNSSVVCKDRSLVVATGKSSVSLYGHTHGELLDKATGTAQDKAAVSVYGDARVFLMDEARGFLYDRAQSAQVKDDRQQFLGQVHQIDKDAGHRVLQNGQELKDFLTFKENRKESVGIKR